MKRNLFFAVASVFVSVSAMASPFTAEELPKRLDPKFAGSTKSLAVFPFTETQVKAFADSFADTLKNQFEQIRREDVPTSTPTCASDAAFKKVRAAYAFGRYEEVLKYSDSCASALDRRAARYAAMAAVGLSQTTIAEKYLRQALDGLTTFSNDDIGTLLYFASWRLDSKLLDLNPAWTTKEKSLYFSVIQLSNRLALPVGVTMSEYNQFVKSELSAPSLSGFKRDFLVFFEARRMFYEDDTDGFELLEKFGPKLSDPSLWARIAYRTVFSSPATMFHHAGIVYRATWPYLHERSSLPTEDNSFTYTEIYDRECKSVLTQAGLKQDFFEWKEKWRSGSVTTADFRDVVEKMDIRNPDKADLLVALSTFAHMDGNIARSRAYAWRAHQLCPYFNRAAHILASLTVEEALHAEPDFASLAAKKDAVVAGATVPAEIAQYMVNWSQLTKHSQENLVWAIEGWLAYIPELVQAKQASYVKFPFELMYEVPTLKEMQDTRSDYDRDNRLWDDMRGLGGEMIVSDYFEAPAAPYGAYNLLEHEMAHQMDFFFESAYPHISQCIQKLFDDATRRDVFVTSYARLRYEYFGVASEAFFVPVDYPLRFGVKRTWYEMNDKGLFDLLEAVTKGPAAAAAHVCSI